MSEYAGHQFVGVDLHRRRTVLVRTTDAGEVLESVRIPNDVDSLNRVIARAGVDPEVVLEATYGWYFPKGWSKPLIRANAAKNKLIFKAPIACLGEPESVRVAVQSYTPFGYEVTPD